MSAKQLQTPAPRQAEPDSPSGGRAFHILHAAALALICALLVDVWLHPPAALPVCEAPVHFAVPKAAPRCFAAPAQFPA